MFLCYDFYMVYTMENPILNPMLYPILKPFVRFYDYDTFIVTQHESII